MNDDLIDNKKYFKYNFPSVSIHKNLYNLKKKLNFHDKKFSCMIAWNKVYKKKSTTNLKIEIIKWFEKNYPQSFDLFGPNWNEKVFSYQNSFTKYLNRNYFRFIRRILSTNYPSWKGNIKSHDKKVTINQYKFVFILENSSEYNGYITDKIFETFTSGSVPIYLGPKNITKYIPHNCFINFRDFKNLKELYSFLVSIDEKNYNNFINNIQIYLKSSNSKLFTTDQFNEDLFKVISFYN
jgi:hypothetical protein